jgi:hypothetical protein
MPRTNYWNTGDAVPRTATYATNCDNAQQQLNSGTSFPRCPTCQLAASWREILVTAASESESKP